MKNKKETARLPPIFISSSFKKKKKKSPALYLSASLLRIKVSFPKLTLNPGVAMRQASGQWDMIKSDLCNFWALTLKLSALSSLSLHHLISWSADKVMGHPELHSNRQFPRDAAEMMWNEPGSLAQGRPHITHPGLVMARPHMKEITHILLRPV